MKKGKFAVNCCLLILLCIIMGGVLVTVANYLPINTNHKNTALEQIGAEGLFPEVPSMQGGYGSFHSMNPTGLELATDSLMLKMALYEGNDEGITQAFRCYSTQYEEEYSRYWHGYVVVLRTLLLFFDYYDIRILNSICQCFVFVACAFYLWKNKGIKYALALASSYILLMPMALSQCLQYTWVFYVTFLGLFIYLYHRQFWENGNRYIYFFILVGASINFLDLLTYPLFTWGLLITWWILLQDKEETIIGYLRKVVCSGIAWIAGYGGMWVGKWTLGSVVLGENLFQKAFSEALLWTVNEGEDAITLHNRLYAILKNWSTYDYKIYLIILIAWLLYWIIRGIFYQNNKSMKAPALLLISCSSIVWYMFLAGHALMHHIFTHRIFGVSIAAFFGIVLLSTEGNLQITNWKKYLIRYVSSIVIISVFSIFLMSQLRDEFQQNNGGPNFTNTELTAPALMTFTPAYSNITVLGIGFSAMNGIEGYCQVQVLDQDTVQEQLILPIEEFAEGNYHEIPVDWKLKAGYPYTLTIEPIENDGQIYLWYTSDETTPLYEYGKLTIGAEEISGQMLAGFTYWCELTENSLRLLFAVTFIGICMMILYSCQCGTNFCKKSK